MLKFLPIFVWAGSFVPINKTMTFEAADEELSKEKIAIVLQEAFDRSKYVHIDYAEVQEVKGLKEKDRVEMADQVIEVDVFTRKESKEKAYVFACKESNEVKKTEGKSVGDIKRVDYVFSRKESKDLIEDNFVKGGEEARILVKDEGMEMKDIGQVGREDLKKEDQLIRMIIIEAAGMKQLIVGEGFMQAKEVDEKMLVEVEDFLEAPKKDCSTVGVRKDSNVCRQYRKKTTYGLHPGCFTRCVRRRKKGRRPSYTLHVASDRNAAKHGMPEARSDTPGPVIACQLNNACRNERRFVYSKPDNKDAIDMSRFPILLYENKRGCHKIVHDTPKKEEKRKELVAELIKEREIENMVSKLVKEELPGRRDGARKRSYREESKEDISSQREEVKCIQHVDHHVLLEDWYPWVLPFAVEDSANHRRKEDKPEEEDHIEEVLPGQKAPPRPPSGASQEAEASHLRQEQDHQRFGKDPLHGQKQHKAYDLFPVNVSETHAVGAPMIVMPVCVPHYYVHAITMEEISPKRFDESAKEAQCASRGIGNDCDENEEKFNVDAVDMENAAGQAIKTRSRRRSTGVKAKQHYRCLQYQGRKEREEDLPRSRLQLELDQEMARRAKAKEEVDPVREEEEEEEDNSQQ